MSERVASVDIGSNSVLMLIAEQGERGVWQRRSDHVEVTRISEGLDANGVLSPEPIARTRRILEAFARIAQEADVDRTMVTGTAPFRRASNGAEVAESLHDVFGSPVDVVSGDREAALSLLATQRSFPELDPMIVIDIGGASTELILAQGSAASMVSLDIGSVRLTERCVRANPISSQDRDALEAAIEAELSRPKVTEILTSGAASLIGIAGTVTTIATVALKMDVYDDTVVHGHRLTASFVRELYGALASETVEARAKRAGLPAARADVLPAGALLLSAIAKRAGVAEITVSDRGTRWGRLYE